MSDLNPEPSLDIQVLGPLVVRVGRHDRTPAGAMPRTVLSVLVARLGSSIDTEALIDAVWDGSPPRSARSALRVHISRIRQTIGVDSLVVTTDRGYRLDTDPQTIDAYRFELGIGEGRRLLQSGAHGPAAEMLGSALREWRDTPYQDGRSVLALESEVLRLATLRGEAGVDLATAEMERSGSHPDIAAIEQLVAEDQLDERRWALLMKALYRCGRQADALAAFQRARSLLGDELGIEPGPDLRDLEEQILLHDPRLSPGEPAGRVDLPGFATSMVGRSDQLSALAKEVCDHRIVTVTGLGGIGKTRLAVGAAKAALPDFPDGAVFVPLDRLAESGSVADAVATRLGVPASPGDPADSLVAHLAEEHLVLVLDNCEHVVEEAAGLVSRLVAECPSVAVLCTSRMPLGVTGETIFPLRPLEVPPPGLEVSSPGDLLAFESVALFCDRARQARTDFSLDADNGPLIAEIVRRLAGVPLSIEIAAAQSDVHTPADILVRLEARPSELVSGERDRPVRHQSMADAVAWSLELLDAPAQELFQRLAVFGSPVDAETIEVVCGDVSLSPGAVRSALASLTRASLLMVDLDGASARYAQLPPIREVALGLLGDAESGLRSRHLAHHAHVASREVGHVGGPDEPESFRRIETALDEFRSALDHAARFERDLGAQLCVDLGTYWIRSGRTREARMWVDRFEGEGDYERSIEASLLHLAGSLALVEQDTDSAERALTAALELRRTSNSPRELAMTLSNLGNVANSRLDYRRAEHMFREALVEFEASGFERGRVASWLNLGVVLTNLDRIDEAIESFEQAVEGARLIGDRAEEANALSRLGYAYSSRGDLARAGACRMASHHITEGLGRPPDIAWSHTNLAAHHLETGDLDRARSHAGRSAAIVEVEALERWWVPDLLELAAHIAAECGDADLGAQLFGCASTYRMRRGIAVAEASREFVTETEGRLKTALGGDAWLVAFEVGRATGLDEALETIADWADL